MQTGAPVEVSLPEGASASSPAMTLLGAGQVVIGYGQLAKGSPAGTAPDLHFAKIDALGPWPAGPIEPLSSKWEHSGGRFRFETPASPTDGFRVVTALEQGGMPVDPVVMGNFALGGGDPVVSQVFSTPQSVLFFANLGSRWMVGADSSNLSADPKHHNLLTAFVETDESVKVLPVDNGCASSPVSADALAVGGKVMLATSSGLDPGLCADQGASAGPPTHVQLLIKASDGGPDLLTFEDILPVGVEQIRLLPAGDGAFLVVTAGYTKMRHVSAGGVADDTSYNLTSDLVVVGQPSLAPLSQGRIAAAFVDGGGQVDHLVLRASSLQSQATANVDDGAPSQPAVVGVSADTMLVSWVRPSASGTSLMVARYRCQHAE